MAINLNRFEGELKTLVEKGDELMLAMLFSAHGKQAFIKMLEEAKRPEGTLEKTEKNHTFFAMYYEAWYSEALAVIKQLLPDRVADFRSEYESHKNRKELSVINYTMSDFLIGLETKRQGTVVADQKAALPKFQKQAAILSAARRRFKSSLFDIKSLVQADIFDSEIDSARELLKNRFLRAAGAVAGVVLEKHLLQVCEDHNVKVIKKHPGIGDLNELLKTNQVLDVPTWRHISMLGDIRNLCDHSKTKEPTETQVSDLIDGTDKILKTVA